MIGWLVFFFVTMGILSACVWAGYRIGRDSRIHEIEDRADDRVYDLKVKHAGSIAALREQYERNFKEGCLGELEAYRFCVQREVRDAIQKVPLTVEDAAGSGVGVMSNATNEFGQPCTP